MKNSKVAIIVLSLIAAVVLIFSVLVKVANTEKHDIEARRIISSIGSEFNLTLFDEMVAYLDTISPYITDSLLLLKIDSTLAIAPKLREEAEKIAEISREQVKRIQREESIKKQFSEWNGAHIILEKYVKSEMNDPDSYEHVETVYWDRDDYLLVQMKFRGNNAFGGKVINLITVRCNISTGQILEIVSYN